RVVLNMGTSTMILTSKQEIPRTDEEPPTNAQNAYALPRWNSRLQIQDSRVGEPLQRGPPPLRSAALTVPRLQISTTAPPTADSFQGLGKNRGPQWRRSGLRLRGSYRAT